MEDNNITFSELERKIKLYKLRNVAAFFLGASLVCDAIRLIIYLRQKSLSR